MRFKSSLLIPPSMSFPPSINQSLSLSLSLSYLSCSLLFSLNPFTLYPTSSLPVLPFSAISLPSPLFPTTLPSPLLPTTLPFPTTLSSLPYYPLYPSLLPSLPFPITLSVSLMICIKMMLTSAVGLVPSPACPVKQWGDLPMTYKPPEATPHTRMHHHTTHTAQHTHTTHTQCRTTQDFLLPSHLSSIFILYFPASS